MDDELDAGQREVRELARRFAATELTGGERGRAAPRAVFDALGELGLLGLGVPRELGGAGGDARSAAVAVEELTRVDADVGVAVAAHVDATLSLLERASERQLLRLLPPLAQGHELAASALASEARLVADEDGRLSGALQGVVGAARADVLLVPARAGGRETAFALRRRAPGVTVARVDPAAVGDDVALDAAEGERLGEPGAGGAA